LSLCAVLYLLLVLHYLIPPVYIFPRKNYRDVLMHGAPGLVNASGWKTSNFVKVLA